MSLRGLVWTLPQGYILEQMGFGWEYSLTGSVMPLIYLIGAHTNTTHIHNHGFRKFVDAPLAVSELIWGTWVWFVLICTCLSQAVRRARIWIYKRNPHVGYKPFSTFEKIKYESLNRLLLRVVYEMFVSLLTVLYCFTLIYYSLISQKDIRNKGQTFFGLFTAVLFLVCAQSWLWGTRYRNFILRRHARRLRGRTRTNNAIYNESSQGSDDTDVPNIVAVASISSSEIDHYEGLSQTVRSSSPSSPKRENGPMLSWPYSHPDRLSPTREQRQQVLDMSERLYPQVGSSRTAFMLVWTKLEKVVWMDMFVLARRTIGLLSLICTIFSFMITITATVVGWNSARFRYFPDPTCVEGV